MVPRILLPFLAILLPGAALAQEWSLGVAAPLSGAQEVLGRQVAAGAAAGADDDAAIIAADTECSAEGGEAAARSFIEAEASAVIGFLCTPALEAALPILTGAGIPTITVGVRANRITDRRERTEFAIWRLAPRSDAEAEALAAFVRENWRGSAFGIVEDGSAYARDLTDEVRARLGPDSIEPALVDNYRPAEDRQFAIARRIAQSGVTRLLIFGNRRDVSIIARDAAELGLSLDIVGGEHLVDEPAPDADLPSGTRALAIPEAIAAALEPEEGEEVEEGYFVPAFAAAEIVSESLRLAGEDGRELSEILDAETFQTRLGPIVFDEKGDSDWQAYGVLVWDGNRFVPEPQS